VIEFLDAIQPPNQDPLGFGMIELRAIGTDGKVLQSFEASPARIEATAMNLSSTHDVYFGVLPRNKRMGDSSSIADYTSVLWGDYDPKGLDKRQVFLELTRLRPPPQIVVDSGSGYHVYWLLREAADFESARMVMNEIAAQTGGDHVSDKARILRVPGTLNHKFSPPRPVRLLRLDLLRRRYKLSDFADYFNHTETEPEAPSFEEVFGPPQRRKGMVPGGIPSWLAALIEKDPGHGSRSEHAFHVAACLAEVGLSDLEIEVIFQENPQGVGAKYAEKGVRGHQWLMTTLSAARSRM
jgi:hypothetical protein